MPYAVVIAVELQEVRLEGIEDVDTEAGGEWRREHQPADRRIAKAPVDRPAKDAPDLGPDTRAANGLEAEIVHEAKGDQEGHAQQGGPDRYGTPRLVAWAMKPPITEPISIAAPVTICARAKTDSSVPW